MRILGPEGGSGKGSAVDTKRRGGIHTFAEILDELDDASRNTFPFAQLHFRCISSVILLYQTDGIKQDESMVGDVDECVWRCEAAFRR